MGSRSTKPSPSSLILAAIAALFVVVPFALAEELTHDEYVVRAERVCKANAKTSARIQKGVNQKINKGQLVPAGKRVIRVSVALGKAVRKIDRLPKPAADAATLKRWIGLLRIQQRFLVKIGKALKAGKRGQANAFGVKLNQKNKKANNTVLSFGFRECRIESAQFLG